MITTELQISDEAIKELIRNAARSAAMKAAEVYSEEWKRNLEPHRSSETGTAERKSEQQKAADDGTPLADSIRMAATELGAAVFIDPDNFLEGYVLEYGAEAVEWGRPAGERQADPHMRPAFDHMKRSAMVAFVDEFERQLNAGD